MAIKSSTPDSANLTTIFLNSNGDGFHLDWKNSRLSDKEKKEAPDAIVRALDCKTHDAVLKFLEGLSDEDKQKVEFWHSHDFEGLFHKPKYPSHYCIKGAAHECTPERMRTFVEQRIVDSNPKIRKSDKLAHLIFASESLKKIDGVLQKADIGVNFWGSRQVFFKRSYDGLISLDRIAREMIKTISEKPSDEKGTKLWSDEEKEVGQRIVTKIQDLYTKSDNRIELKNLITQIISWIREFNWFNSNTPRSFFEEGKDVFDDGGVDF